jgi:protein phosphatase
VRARNEDYVAVYPDAGLAIIADGIGGASAGEVASHLAVDTVNNRFRAGSTLPLDRDEALYCAEAAVDAANQAIWQKGQADRDCAGMGTTLVLGYARNDWLVFTHVGDSRLYRLRDGKLVQLTRDHSLIQDVVDQGFFPTLRDAERYGINSNILTRGLGSSDSVIVDTGQDELRSGDLYLFCTDGLTGMVSDDRIRRALSMSGASDDLARLCRSLIDLALEGGGRDNISVALMHVS